jgi:hypothetical protein
MKITAFWDIAPCNVVEVKRRFTITATMIRVMPDDRNSAHL